MLSIDYAMVSLGRDEIVIELLFSTMLRLILIGTLGCASTLSFAEDDLQLLGKTRNEGYLPALNTLKSDEEQGEDIRYDVAITLAELSILAYTDAHNRELVLRLMDFDSVTPLDDGPMSGFIAISGDVAVIAFRGTNQFSPSDWLANIDLFWQKSMGGGRKFHRGFHSAYDRFARTIRLELSAANVSQVWLTGHSLGGAMAVCGAYDMILHKRPVSGLVTFGQPRVANRLMADYIDKSIGKQYLRFRNGNDIVPTVPAEDGMLSPDYAHAGRLIWYKDGEIDSWEVGEAARAIGSSQDAGDDELNAEELMKFQEYLRRHQSSEIEQRIPYFLMSDVSRLRPPEVTLPAYDGDETSRGLSIRSSYNAVTSRFSHHAMFEYLRFLNDEYSDRKNPE